MTVKKISPVLTTALQCHSPQEIARLASVSLTTAKRWCKGYTQPNASALLRLIARSKRVRYVVAEQLSKEWLDAEETRLAAELADVRTRSNRSAKRSPLAKALVRAADAGATAALGPVNRNGRSTEEVS